ncbi:hypothetical protein [Haematomicrobium sanguinis]|uniref:hypothetical protein n=1 Tax=Haematomicrobium sanguinis TaxID=479106 RepID=UPI00047D5763|nr:hypothetical protein [Haematomicrobium sanguinis]
MFGLGKKQPTRPEPVKPDDWDQRLPAEKTRKTYQISGAFYNAADSKNYPSLEAWSKDVGQQAINEFWQDEGPVSQQEFLAQINGWAYAWKESTFPNFYVHLEAPDWGVTAILTLMSLDAPIYAPADYLADLNADAALQRRLLSPIDFETFTVPAGPAARASYQVHDFFNGANTTVYRENILVFTPITREPYEISAAAADPTMVPFIKDQTRLIADTIEVYVPE